MITTTIIIAAFTTTAQAEPQPIKSAAIARAQVATWQCQDHLAVARTPVNLSPWRLHPSRREAIYGLWTQRLRACRAELAEKKRQWDWQAWLPDKWRRIGVCETQLNWQHSNSSYEGAFGFAKSSWDAFKLEGYPEDAWQASPWEQYQTALAIWRAYGYSGWGCRNA